MRGFLRHLAGGYRAVAVVLLSTVWAFALLNLLAWAGLQVKEHLKQALGAANPVLARYGERILEAYPAMSRAEINRLLVETWGRGQEYEAVTGLREAPFRGAYVNVAEAGYRHSAGQGPWPPAPQNFNLFLFGGSTTFGYGVADDETLASALQARLDGRAARPVRVYNFGRANYHSTRERLLFETLVFSGHRPALAVFVDGINEFTHATDSGAADAAVRAALAAGPGERLMGALRALPIARAADWVSASLLGPPPQAVSRDAEPPAGERDFFDAVIERYDRNALLIRAVADVSHIPVAFVWHPIPSYRAAPARHPFPEQIGAYQSRARGYEALRATRARGPDAGLIWCADIQDGLAGYLYVDAVHFNPVLNGVLADCIAAGLARTTRLLAPAG